MALIIPDNDVGALHHAEDDDIETDNFTLADRKAWEERTGVRKEIYALISKYMTAPKVPHFATADMIVMAVLCSNRHALSPNEILEWILDTFAYYRLQVLRHYMSTDSYEFAHPSDRVKMVIADFYEAFNRLDVPLKDPDNKDIIVAPDPRRMDQFKVTVPTEPGRMYLCRSPAPERKGIFNWVQLPGEIRNHIYKMALSIPHSIVILRDRYPGAHELEAVSEPRNYSESEGSAFEQYEMDPGAPTQPHFKILKREHDTFKPDFSWPDDCNISGGVRGPTVKSVLEKLSFNEEFREEALEQFYQWNTFQFNGIQPFDMFTRSVRPGQLEHLGHIRISCMPGSMFYHSRPNLAMVNFSKAMRRLLPCKSLRKVEIHIDEDSWIFELKLFSLIPRAEGASAFPISGEQLPGIAELAVVASRAESFVAYEGWPGGCLKIKTYIESEIEKAKAKAKAKANGADSGSKKRDREGMDDDNEDEGGDAKRARTGE